MNFQEMGLELKQARERRGLSIEEVMEITKISRLNLVALEEGDREKLPHPVYAKGFIRSYARLLGLDAEEMALVVDQDMAEAEASLPAGYEVSADADKAFTMPDAPVASTKSRWPSIVMIVLLVGALVGLVIYFGKMKMQPVPQATSSVEQQSAESSVEAPAGVAEESVQEDVAEESQSVQSVQQEAAEAASEEVEAQTPEAPEVVAEKPQTAQTAPDEESVGESQEQESDKQLYAHLLVIRATTDKGCWVGVWKGDEKQMYRDFFLRNGEPLTLKFNSKRRIRIGNVTGAVVTHNGEPYALKGDADNAQTIIFDIP